jgi:hypothetical protein
MTRWPDTWIGRESDGEPWQGKRFVRAAGLKNITQHQQNDPTPSYGYDSSARRRGGFDHIEVQGVDTHTMSSVGGPDRARGNWTVDLAMGFPWTVRSAVNYSGSVVLHFTDTVESGVVYAVGHPTFITNDQDERDAIARNKRKEKRFNGRRETIRMKLFMVRSFFVFVLLFLVGTLFFCYQRLIEGMRSFWSHDMRRKVCRILAKVFSMCECFRVLFARNWYGFFKSRGEPGARSSEAEEDDDESTDRTLLTLNTRHNSITTLNRLTSHSHISLPNIDRSSSSGRVRILKSCNSAGDDSLLELGNIIETERDNFRNDKESEDGDSNYCDVDCDSTIAKSLSLGSNLSSSSSGTIARKKYITWGAFTHLNAPMFSKSGSGSLSGSGSESSSLQSKSTSSSDGGYGSINSLNSLDS